MNSPATLDFSHFFDSDFVVGICNKYPLADTALVSQKLNECGVKYQKLLNKKNHTEEQAHINSLHDKASEIVDVLASFGASEKNRLEYHSRLGMNLAEVMLMINELKDASGMAVKYFPPPMSEEKGYPYFVCWLWMIFRELSSAEDRDNQTLAVGFIEECLSHTALFTHKLKPVSELIDEIQSDKDRSAQITCEFGLLD